MERSESLPAIHKSVALSIEQSTTQHKSESAPKRLTLCFQDCSQAWFFLVPRRFSRREAPVNATYLLTLLQKYQGSNELHQLCPAVLGKAPASSRHGCPWVTLVCMGICRMGAQACPLACQGSKHHTPSFKSSAEAPGDLQH